MSRKKLTKYKSFTQGFILEILAKKKKEAIVRNLTVISIWESFKSHEIEWIDLYCYHLSFLHIIPKNGVSVTYHNVHYFALYGFQ